MNLKENQLEENGVVLDGFKGKGGSGEANGCRLKRYVRLEVSFFDDTTETKRRPTHFMFVCLRGGGDQLKKKERKNRRENPNGCNVDSIGKSTKQFLNEGGVPE